MKKLFIWAILLIVPYTFAQKLNVVGGYFPYYKSTNNVNFSNYNYLYYAFVNPTATGGLRLTGSSTTAFNNFKSATNGLNSKRLISIGTEGMSVMAKSAQARLLFADTLRKFCRLHKFDGIDLDWESIDNVTDRTNFTALCQDIRETIDTTNLLFTITVGYGNYWLQWYENNALSQADFLQIMVYDQTGTWSGSPYGNHASMAHFKDAESYWVGRGFPRGSLVMGLPYYGYKFQSTAGGLATAASYADILARFPNLKSSDNELSDASGYYFFNGVDLIKEKINYAITKGFKGVFVWEIAQDNTKSVMSLDNTLATTAYDKVASVNDHIDNINSTGLYPNPSNGSVTLFGAEKISDLTLHTITGLNIPFKSSSLTDNSILIENIPSGIYIINYKSGAVPINKKLIVE